MNPWGLSPSSFYPDEMQVGRKMDPMHGSHGSKTLGPLRMPSVTSSALENRIPTDHKMAKGFEYSEYYFSHRNSNVSPGNVFLGAGAVSHSLPVAAGHAFSDRINLNTESASYGINGDRINPMGAQSENSLFSSSLSDLFNKKLKLPSNNALYGHFEVEGFESFEKPEVQIVNLPDDDDDLFSGVTDSLDELIRSNDGDAMEDLDLFSHVGGLEIGEDSSSWSNSVPSDLNSNSEHPFGGHPSRTLFVRNINSDVGDAELQLLFEQYGDIRNLYSACKQRGFVMISYYDIRAACNALKALQNKPLWNRELDIHFSIPKDNSSENDANQATVAVFNLNSSLSNDKLREIFSVYGEIKEIRDAPHRSQHKFVEFYDVRAAQSAHRSLKRSDIAGKQTKLEPGPSGGPNRLMRHLSSELEQEEFGARLPVPQHTSSYSAAGFPVAGPISVGGTSASIGNAPIQRPRSINGGSVVGTFLDHNGVSSSVPDGLANQTSIPQPGHLRDQINFGSPNFRPHSLPEYHDGLVNGRSFGPPGHHHPWNSNSHHPQSQSIAWPSSPSFINGIGNSRPQQLPQHMLNPFHPLSNHHVGSAPSVNHPMWDRRHSYAGESLDAVFQMGISGTSPHHMEYAPHNMFPRNTSGNCMDVKTPKGVGIPQHHQRCMILPPTGQLVPMMSSSFDSPNERTRSRRHDGRSSSSQTDSKKQFELDIDRILRGEDKRTTLMIKNIPNKYTSKMLLAAIDECHRGVYDFLYLPIDFKNKCNVGYAFINITEPSHIVPFYQTINGKKWEKFNSEKVATLAYARIQGRASLIAHFQNSSLMNEDKRCRPILFNIEGPNAGDQLPFPMGNNIRPRSGKIRSGTIGENNQEMPSEDFTCGDSSSGSGKDSD